VHQIVTLFKNICSYRRQTQQIQVREFSSFYALQSVATNAGSKQNFTFYFM